MATFHAQNSIDTAGSAVGTALNAAERAKTALRTLGHAENRITKNFAKVDSIDLEEARQILAEAKRIITSSRLTETISALQDYEAIMVKLDAALDVYEEQHTTSEVDRLEDWLSGGPNV